MQIKFLFPHYIKKLGWFIFIPSSVLGGLALFNVYDFEFLNHIKVFAFYDFMFSNGQSEFTLIETNIADELFGILFIVGALLVAFSKEKQEDEFISNLRLESLVWATYINYAILILCMLFFYGFGFLYVMIFNMFTILIIFIFRFYFLLYTNRKMLSNEK
jgi:hypothetical protein